MQEVVVLYSELLTNVGKFTLFKVCVITTWEVCTFLWKRWYLMENLRGESAGKTKSREGQNFVIALVREQVGSYVTHF